MGPRPAVAAGLPGLHVAGNQLVDATGQVVVLHGVNRSGSEYACIQGWGIFDGPNFTNDDAQVPLMKQWGINEVNLGLNEDCWLGINGVLAAYGGASYINAIAHEVATLESYGIYPVLSLFWEAAGSAKATGQTAMPDNDHAAAFWQSVATTFKSDPRVILRLKEEPYPAGNTDGAAAWSCWKNGDVQYDTSNTLVPISRTTNCSEGYPTVGMQSLINIIRGTGAPNVIQVPGVEYANSMTHFLDSSYRVSDPASQPGLMGVVDVYPVGNICGSSSCYDAEYAPVIAQMPFLAGEFGESVDGNTCTTSHVDALMSWFDGHGAGYSAWTWDTWGGCLQLINDYSTGNPNGAWGTDYKQHVLSLPSSPPCTCPPPTLPTPRGAYHPVSPFRVLDTRVSQQTLGPNSTLTFQAIGQGGVPSSGVTAVVLNVTATNTTANGWMAVFPGGLGVPNASNLNWNAGQTVPNLVEVAVGSTGMVSLYSPLGQVDAVVDVEGYVTAPSGTTGLYNPLVPARLLDTRPGHQTLGPNGSITFPVTGQGGVPSSGVSAVVLNVTATDTTSAGWLTVYPAGQGTPNASNLNWSPGETRPNRVIVPVGTNGEVTVYSPLGSVDVVVDVGGYFTDGSNPSATGTLFSGTSPARILDTRSMGGPVGPGGSVHLQVAGQGGVPSTGVSAVVLNVTATSPTTAGWLVAYPSNSGIPTASDLNYGPGETIPNLVVVKLGADGAINLYNCCGQVQVIADVEGWYS